MQPVNGANVNGARQKKCTQLTAIICGSEKIRSGRAQRRQRMTINTYFAADDRPSSL